MQLWQRIILSALCYALSYISTGFLAGIFSISAIIIAFFLLFSLRFHNFKEAFFFGFLWGSIGFGLSQIALIDVLIFLGNGKKAVICAAFFVFWWAVLSAIWFTFTHLLYSCKLFKYNSWVLVSYIFFTFVAHAVWLPIVGMRLGYGFVCPVVIFSNWPCFLRLLPLVGWPLLRFCFFLTIGGCVSRSPFFVVAGALPFLCGLLLPESPEKKDERIVLMAKRFTETTAYERAQELCLLFIEAQQKYPEGKLFLFPESAFPYPLSEHPYAVKMWQRHCKTDETSMVLGSYAQNNENLFNAIYQVNKCRIRLLYVKTKLLPFFEKPSFFNPLCYSLNYNLYLPQKAFTPGQSGQTKRFRLCCELLWDIPNHQTLFLLVNDGYYRFRYFSQLLKLFARFQALRKESTIIYVGWVESGIV